MKPKPKEVRAGQLWQYRTPLDEAVFYLVIGVDNDDAGYQKAHFPLGLSVHSVYMFTKEHWTFLQEVPE